MGSCWLIILVLALMPLRSHGELANSLLSGRLQASAECERSRAQIWLSIDSLLLSQLESSTHGDFQFHVLPGTYSLTATSSENCSFHQNIEIKAGETKLIQVDLKPGTLKQKLAQDSFSPLPLPAYFSNPYLYPTWQKIGAESFTNFHSPGPWYANGINVNYYPGEGNIISPKQNIYLSGNSKVTMKIKMKESSSWLSSSPSYTPEGWNLIEGSTFNYSFRLDAKKLQDQAGFCTIRENLIPQLAEGLKDSGFREEEIRDFAEYWSLKIPYSKKYCVFPQGNKELANIAELELSEELKQQVRVLYIVVPEESLLADGEKFTKEPKKKWNFLRAAQLEGSDLKLHEWGMGFLQGAIK